MEPGVPRDVDAGGEARTVVDLPVAAGGEDRRVLDGVGVAGFVRPQVDLLGVGAVGRDPELEAEEAARRGRRDVHVDDPVAHLEVLHGRRAAVEQQALPAEEVGRLRVSLELPAGGVGGKGRGSGSVSPARRDPSRRSSAAATAAAMHAPKHTSLEIRDDRLGIVISVSFDWQYEGVRAGLRRGVGGAASSVRPRHARASVGDGAFSGRFDRIESDRTCRLGTRRRIAMIPIRRMGAGDGARAEAAVR